MRSTSSRRFSSALAITRSGANAAMVRTSGFLVPPTFLIDSTCSAGSTQNFVTPTIRSPSPRANSVSVQLGTSETILAGELSRSTLKPRSSVTCTCGIGMSPAPALEDVFELLSVALGEMLAGRRSSPASGRRGDRRGRRRGGPRSRADLLRRRGGSRGGVGIFPGAVGEVVQNLRDQGTANDEACDKKHNRDDEQSSAPPLFPLPLGH